MTNTVLSVKDGFNRIYTPTAFEAFLYRFSVLQAISLVLRLTHRASRIFKDFSDGEIIKVLSALMILKQHDDELLAAMEKHLPGIFSSD